MKEIVKFTFVFINIANNTARFPTKLRIHLLLKLTYLNKYCPIFSKSSYKTRIVIIVHNNGIVCTNVFSFQVRVMIQNCSNLSII